MSFNLVRTVLLLLAIAQILSGCKPPPLGDEACTINVTTVATINNMTGRPMTLSVCTPMATKPRDIQVTGEQTDAFAIESHNEQWIKTGGPANACDGQKRKSTFSLTAASFNQITLCRQQGDNTQMAIVELGQPCPQNYIPQAQPISDSCL